MVRLLLAGLVALTLAGPAPSADGPDSPRERKARVALALTSPDPAPTAADARVSRVAAALKAACPCPTGTCPCPAGVCEKGLCVPAVMPVKPAPKDQFTPPKAPAPAGEVYEERDHMGWRVLVKAPRPGADGILVAWLRPLPPPPPPPTTTGFALPVDPFGGYCPPGRA